MRLGQLPALAVIRQQLPRHVTDTGVQWQEPTGPRGRQFHRYLQDAGIKQINHEYSRFDLLQEARQVQDSIPTARTSLPTPQVAHDPKITLEIIYFSTRHMWTHANPTSQPPRLLSKPEVATPLNKEESHQIPSYRVFFFIIIKSISLSHPRNTS